MIQNWFSSIDWDLIKCPIYKTEWGPHKRPKKARKGRPEESKFKDSKKVCKWKIIIIKFAEN